MVEGRLRAAKPRFRSQDRALLTAASQTVVPSVRPLQGHQGSPQSPRRDEGYEYFISFPFLSKPIILLSINQFHPSMLFRVQHDFMHLVFDLVSGLPYEQRPLRDPSGLGHSDGEWVGDFSSTSLLLH